MEKWFKSHNFTYVKTKNKTYFWQTDVATGEITAKGKIIWHEKNFFKEVQEKLDKN